MKYIRLRCMTLLCPLLLNIVVLKSCTTRFFYVNCQPAIYSHASFDYFPCFDEIEEETFKIVLSCAQATIQDI